MSNIDGFVDATRTGDDLSKTVDGLHSRTNGLGISASQFGNVMTKAFTDVVAGGKKFDDVLKSVGLRLSALALQQAFKPIAKDIGGGLSKLIGGLFTDVFSSGKGGGSNDARPDGLGFGGLPSPFDGLKSIFPFASGGVIGAPTYFPLPSGGLGLAGEAGPEAIVPLARGSNGRLGIATAGTASPTNVTVHIATPDAASFKRSEAYITGQIARAVARGQRNL
jgi:phage-related minor tail protein